MLNGIEFAGGAASGTSPGGASGQLLGIDAVREFNVQAHTYGAEYGKRAGGQISIVTMSGGNQFHGSAFEFLRNSFFDARNFFDQEKPQFKRNDFGAAAGGPIRKDKTFIFGNYEGYRQSLTTTNVSFVPDANARRGFLPIGPGEALVNVGLAPGIAPYFALWPDPNGPNLGGGIAEGFMAAVNPVQEDFGTVRLDHVFSEKDWLTGAYTIDDGSNTIPGPNPLSGTVLTERMQVLSLEETHTFSPAVINTVRIGFSRGGFFSDGRPLISLPASLSLTEGEPMGQLNIGGGTSTGSTHTLSPFGGSGGEPRIRNLFTYTDSVQISRGKHLINLGAWFERVQFNFTNVSGGYGSVAFPDLQAFLQGKASTFQGSLNPSMVYARQWEGAWYVADTIKLLPNLTLNLGLRHEFTNGWNVKSPIIMNYLFGPDRVIRTEPLIGTSMFTENNAKWLLNPRIGLAWDPFGKGKTSIHAGFGTYHNLMDDLGYVTPQAGRFQLSNIQFPFRVAAGRSFPVGGVPAPRYLSPPYAKTATVQQWSLTVEQQITADTAVSIGYVGSHGYRFLGNSDLNPSQSVSCSTSLRNCPAGLTDGTKFYPPGPRRRNPNIGSTTTWLAFVNSSYNSLQIDLKQRLSKGLTFRANYSFSKALDDNSTGQSAFFTNCPSRVVDPYNPLMDYGPSCYDVTHRFSFHGSYDLPLGQGKAFLGGVSGAADKLLGGWKLNGIVSVQNGLPFPPTIGFNNSRDGDTSLPERPSLNPNFSGPVTLGTPNQWFDPRAFILPPAGTYGNLGRNTLRRPGLKDVDLSLFKDTRISEKLNLQFRAEIFNFLNHTNLGGPNAALFTSSGALVGSAGVITYTTTTSRQIQLGMKLIW